MKVMVQDRAVDLDLLVAVVPEVVAAVVHDPGLVHEVDHESALAREADPDPVIDVRDQILNPGRSHAPEVGQNRQRKQKSVRDLVQEADRDRLNANVRNHVPVAVVEAATQVAVDLVPSRRAKHLKNDLIVLLLLLLITSKTNYHYHQGH